jgi:uncharacterized membrane protein
MAFEVLKPFLWALGVGLSLMSLFTFYWPRYQFKMMKLLKLQASVKSDQKIRRLAVLKLAVGLAVMSLAALL